MTSLRHQRIAFPTAAAFVSEHHRHHTAPVGHVFSLGAFRGDNMVGCAIVGRPVSRHRDDGLTAEVTRLCCRDGERNAASFLLGKAARAALALGFRRIGTYTLKREERYFNAACRRIEEAYRQPRLFAEPEPKPVQPSLYGDVA
jgi:hypothetical protein